MSVRRTVLDNGLTVVTKRLPHVRSVSLGIWIKLGSRHERPEQNGISHFIEHLLFKGTKNRSARQIAKDIDSIGGQLDAFTSREFVGFYAKFLDEHLEAAFDLLSEIVLHPRFSAAEIERERNVIYEEIKMTEDNPADLIHDFLMASFWKNHPLGRPISGTKSILQSLSRRAIAGYFQKAYLPTNMLIVAAGHLRHQSIMALARDYFDHYQGSPNSFPSNTIPQAHKCFIVRNKRQLEQSHFYLGTIAPPISSSDRYVASVLSNILGGGFSSRLFQNIREKRGLAYAVFSSLNLYLDAGMLVIYAGSSAKTIPEVVDLTLKECRKLCRRPVTEDELGRSKENIKGSVVLGMESTSSHMTQMAQQEIYFQRNFPLNEILKKVEEVTREDIMRVAREIFDDRYLSMAAIGNLSGVRLSEPCLQ